PLTHHPAAVYLSQLAPRSRRTMRQALNSLAAYLTQGQCDAFTLDWSKLRYPHTAALRSILMEKYSPATANRMLCALRRTLKEAQRLKLIPLEDYADAVDLPNIRGERLPKGRVLELQEITALFTVCLSDSSPAGLRDAAMIGVLMGGLRRGEVVALTVGDLNPKTGALTIRQGKGNKGRITYLPEGALKAVLDWLECRGNPPGALLCPVGRWGTIQIRHMRDQVVMNVLSKRAKQANIAPFAPHDLRRTFISNLLNTADLLTVQQLVGHADPATTAKYNLRGEAVKREAVGRLDVPYPSRSEARES
ncbi:MAG: tyrosine-type recombinase/integrase, partial [Halothece sp.]